MRVSAQQARRILEPLERNVLIIAAEVGEDPARIRTVLEQRGRRVGEDGRVSESVYPTRAPTQFRIFLALRSGRRKLEEAARRPPPPPEPERPRTWRPGGKRVTVPAVTRSPKEDAMNDPDPAGAPAPPAEPTVEEDGEAMETWEERTHREALGEHARISAHLEALQRKQERVEAVIRATGGEVPEYPPLSAVPPAAEAAEEDGAAPEPPPPASGGEEPEEPPANGEVPEELRHLPAAQTGGPVSQRVRTARGQLVVLEAIKERPGIVVPEITGRATVASAGLDQARVGKYVRDLIDAGLVAKNGRKRLPAGRSAGKHAEELIPRSHTAAPSGEDDDSPEREPTLEEVRDRVVRRDGSFGVGDVAKELGAARAVVSQHFEWLEARRIIEVDRYLPDGAALYRYVRRVVEGPVERRRELPPEAALIDRAGAERRGPRREVRHGVRGWTNNKDVNKLLRRYRDEDHALVEVPRRTTGGGHIRVRFPNGATVRVSSSPDPTALPWIEQDLEHARHGRFEQIQNGGLGAAERAALGSAAQATQEV